MCIENNFNFLNLIKYLEVVENFYIEFIVNSIVYIT